MQTKVNQVVAAFEAGKLTRRELLSVLLLAGTSAAAALTPRSVSAQTRASVLRARMIKSVNITVSDLQRSATFYQQLFGLPALRPLAPSGNSPAYGLDFNGRFISLSPQPKGGLITQLGIAVEGFGVDGFQPKRDGDALRAAGFDVEISSDYVLVRDPDGESVKITDTKYRAACASCPRPPAGAIAPDKGKTPIFRPLTVNHVGLTISNLQRSAAFYRKLFGLPPLRALIPPGPNGDSTAVGLDLNESYLCMSAHPEEHVAGGFSHFCIGVDEINAKRDLERIRAAGWQAQQSSWANAPAADPEGHQQLSLRDPDGISLQIVHATWKAECPTCREWVPGDRYAVAPASAR